MDISLKTSKKPVKRKISPTIQRNKSTDSPPRLRPCPNKHETINVSLNFQKRVKSYYVQNKKKEKPKM